MTIFSCLRAFLAVSLLLAVGSPAIAAPAQPQSSPADMLNVELVGHIGGSPSVVFVKDNYAYVGFGPEMAILDTTDPANLERIGYLVLTEEIQDIIVAGSYAYVTAGSAGLRVVDVSNPAVPTEIGAFISAGFLDNPIQASKLAVSENTVYLIDSNSGLRILDVSEPADPRQIGSLTTDWGLTDIVISGSYAYLPDGMDGLIIVDITEKTQPVEVGVFQSGILSQAIAISGNIAYLTGDSFLVLDISNPVAPVQLGRIAGYGGVDLAIGEPDGQGHLPVYLASWLHGRVQVIDASDPYNPIALVYYPTGISPASIAVAGGLVYAAVRTTGLHALSFPNLNPMQATGFFDTPGQPAGVDVEAGLAFIADGEAGMRIVDVSNPQAPVETGSLTSSGYAGDIQVGRLNPSGHRYAYIVETTQSDQYNGGLRIVDVTDPSHPVETGFFDDPGSPFNLVIVGDDMLGDRYAFLTGTVVEQNTVNVLRILDISDPAHPVELSRYDNPNFSPDVVAVSELDAQGHRYAYIGSFMEFLQILDVTDPANPQLIKSLPIYPAALLLSGNLLYLTDTFANFQILDISNPDLPVTLGSSSMQGYELAFDGERVYCLDSSEVMAVDLSDLTHPLDFASFITESTFLDLEVIGGYAYLVENPSGESGGGLRIVSVTGIEPPIQRGVHPTPTIATAVSTGGQPLVAVLTTIAATTQVQILDSTNPADLSRVGSLTLPSDFKRIKVQGDYAYLAGSYWLNDSLNVVDLSNPAIPALVTLYDSPGNASDVVLDGNYAYLADSYGVGLVVLNITDPVHPVEVFQLGLYAYAYDLFRTGDWLYLLTANQGTWTDRLDILNVADPTNPVEVGSFLSEVPWYSRSVAAGDPANHPYVYISADNGVHILDVSNPSDPVEIGIYNLRWTGWTVSQLALGEPDIYGRRYLYIANADIGLEVVDVTDPYHPFQAGYYDTAGIATDIDLAGDLVYLADDAGGLYLLRFTGYAVSGAVRQPNQQPFAGVTISAGGGYSAVSDATGSFAVMGLPPGDYILTPDLPGYRFAPANWSAGVPPNAAGAGFTILPLPVSADLSPGVALSLGYTDTQGLPTVLDFPVGAVDQSVTLNLTPTLASAALGSFFTGHAFDLEALDDGRQPGFTFLRPVTVTIDYSDFDVWVVTDENALSLSYWDGSAWVEATTTCDPGSLYNRDPANNRLSVPVCQTGLYALFGPTHQVRLPVVFNESR